MTTALPARPDNNIIFQQAYEAVTRKKSFEVPNQVKNLYDRSDVVLALSNAFALASIAYSLSNPVTRAVRVALFVSNIWQSIQAYNAIPDSAVITKALANPMIPLLSLLHPLFGKIHSVATYVGVAQNSLPKIWTCLKNGFSHPLQALTGTALHIFNLGSQGYVTAHAFKEYDAQAQGEPKEEPTAKCSSKSASEFAKMSDTERLSTAELNPNCPADALKMMKAEPGATCADLKKIYRKLSLNVHPDKTTDAKASQAFANLSAAYETLKAERNCKSK